MTTTTSGPDWISGRAAAALAESVSGIPMSEMRFRQREHNKLNPAPASSVGPNGQFQWQRHEVQAWAETLMTDEKICAWATEAGVWDARRCAAAAEMSVPLFRIKLVSRAEAGDPPPCPLSSEEVPIGCRDRKWYSIELMTSWIDRIPRRQRTTKARSVPGLITDTQCAKHMGWTTREWADADRAGLTPEPVKKEGSTLYYEAAEIDAFLRNDHAAKSA